MQNPRARGFPAVHRLAAGIVADRQPLLARGGASAVQPVERHAGRGPRRHLERRRLDVLVVLVVPELVCERERDRPARHEARPLAQAGRHFVRGVGHRLARMRRLPRIVAAFADAFQTQARVVTQRPLAHRPVPQPASCHGTRIERWRKGSVVFIEFVREDGFAKPYVEPPPTPTRAKSVQFQPAFARACAPRCSARARRCDCTSGRATSCGASFDAAPAEDGVAPLAKDASSVAESSRGSPASAMKQAARLSGARRRRAAPASAASRQRASLGRASIPPQREWEPRSRRGAARRHFGKANR